MKTPYYREAGFVGLCDAVPCIMPFTGYKVQVHTSLVFIYSWTVERLILHGGCSLMLWLLGAIEFPTHRFPSFLFYYEGSEDIKKLSTAMNNTQKIFAI